MRFDHFCANRHFRYFYRELYTIPCPFNCIKSDDSTSITMRNSTIGEKQLTLSAYTCILSYSSSFETSILSIVPLSSEVGLKAEAAELPGPTRFIYGLTGGGGASFTCPPPRPPAALMPNRRVPYRRAEWRLCL